MKIVLVEWDDTFADIRWTSIDNLHVAPMVSIGCLMRINEKEVVLSSMRGREGIDDSNCVQAIPRGCVKRIRQLKVAP